MDANIQAILIAAIILVESGGDPNAVGDKGEAVGVLQIHKTMVDDCNRIYGSKRWSYDDRKDRAQSIQMFQLYTDHYTPSWDPEKVARRWNGGPKGDRKKATLPYWTKVQKAMIEQSP